MNFLIVFLSGGLGSVLRYAAGLAVQSSLFPWATLLVNVVGCLAIGLFSGLTTRFAMGEGVRLALTVGLCGGFTTFSTFSKETLELAVSGRWGVFGLYVAGSVFLGLAAVALGFFCVRCDG